MPKIVFPFLIICVIILPIPSSMAGGAVAAIRQRQLEEQRAVIQQAVVQKQQQEMVRHYMAAYQQAAVEQYVQAQKQAIVQAQQQAVAQQITQQMAARQMVAQRMNQEVMAYREAVSRRQQMLAQEQALRIKVVQNAQYQEVLMAKQVQQYRQQAATVRAMQHQSMAEYQRALLAKEIGQRAVYEKAQTMYAAKAAQQARQVGAYQQWRQLDENRLYEDIPSNFVQDVVGISELWKSLDVSSKAWPLVIDNKAKGVTVSHYVQELSRDGAVIRKDPLHYAKMIDDMSFQNPGMLEQPFKEVLRIVAVIEYDYDNGVDKDTLARRIFPSQQAFEANRKRLGM